ncbi:MAG: DMT family transporter [Pseudomonadota bacterium]|nr:DMT family transporter [Pseudomonadota bacterium]
MQVFHQFLKDLWQSPHILLILTTLMWAGHANVLKVSIGEVSPMLLMALRWIGCSLILLFFLWSDIKIYLPKARKQWRWLWLMGGLGIAGFTTCLIIAAQYTSVINLGITQSFIPALVMLLGIVLLKNTISGEQGLGLILSMLGAFVLVSGGSIETIKSMNLNFGDIIMLIGCLCYACYTLGLTKRIELPGMIMFLFFSFFASLTHIVGLSFEFLNGNVVWPSPKGWLAVIYCIIFPSIISQRFFMRGVELIGANRAGLYVNLVPVFTAVLAILFLAESLYFFHIVSLILVLGGIYITERFKRG